MVLKFRKLFGVHDRHNTLVRGDQSPSSHSLSDSTLPCSDLTGLSQISRLNRVLPQSPQLSRHKFLPFRPWATRHLTHRLVAQKHLTRLGIVLGLSFIGLPSLTYLWHTHVTPIQALRRFSPETPVETLGGGRSLPSQFGETQTTFVPPRQKAPKSTSSSATRYDSTPAR